MFSAVVPVSASLQLSIIPSAFVPLYRSEDQRADRRMSADRDLAMLRSIADKRPAPRQVASFAGPSATDLSRAAQAGEYNIWHDKPTRRSQKEAAKHRVNVARDAGLTGGNDNPGAFICHLFAKGCCHQGEECRFLHRIPFADDLAKISMAQDIFGRERHATNLSDMSGVGTWSKDQRTMYVGKLAASVTDQAVRCALCCAFLSKSPISSHVSFKNAPFW